MTLTYHTSHDDFVIPNYYQKPPKSETKEFRDKNLAKLEAMWKTTEYPTKEQRAKVEGSQVGPKESHYNMKSWFEMKRRNKKKVHSTEDRRNDSNLPPVTR